MYPRDCDKDTILKLTQTVPALGEYVLMVVH